ncbi:glycosyltransferase [candidate division KSB1 bacterium]|nr:glycosyltransferase [candidate division KSB1 bacterium]
MRICIVTHCYPSSTDDIHGNWIPDFAQLLLEKGHQVFILTPRMKNALGKRRLISWPFEVIYFEWRGGEKRLGDLKLLNPQDMISLFSLLNYGIKELVRLIDENNIDICLGVWTIPGGYLCYRAQKEVGIPYVVWSLGSDVNVYGRKRVFRRVITRVLKNANYVFSNSRELTAKVSEWSGKPCGFMPTNRNLSAGGEVKITVDETAANFLFIGRLEKVKGIDVLIDAMSGLLSEGQPAFLYVLGDGVLKADLEKKVERDGWKGNIIFTGWADPGTVAAYLRACDVLIIPSRSEGMPVVFQEAMQLQIPVIVTNVGDMGRLTRKFGVGEVVEHESIIQLKAAMKAMVGGDKENYKKKMNEIANEYDLRKSAETFLMRIKS